MLFHATYSREKVLNSWYSPETSQIGSGLFCFFHEVEHLAHQESNEDIKSFNKLLSGIFLTSLYQLKSVACFLNWHLNCKIEMHFTVLKEIL